MYMLYIHIHCKHKHTLHIFIYYTYIFYILYKAYITYLYVFINNMCVCIRHDKTLVYVPSLAFRYHRDLLALELSLRGMRVGRSSCVQWHQKECILSCSVSFLTLVFSWNPRRHFDDKQKTERCGLTLVWAQYIASPTVQQNTPGTRIVFLGRAALSAVGRLVTLGQWRRTTWRMKCRKGNVEVRVHFLFWFVFRELEVVYAAGRKEKTRQAH